MSEFKREDRYVVVKHSDLDKIPNTDVKHRFLSALAEVNNHSVQVGQRQFVVIEDDWPEYEQVWNMIQNRVEGKAATPSEDGREVPEIVGKFCWMDEDMGDGYYVQCVHDLPEHIIDNERELMTVAQHERILMAKDAEIARLTEERDAHMEVARDRLVRLQRVKGDLRAQPARQVDVDEREAFEHYIRAEHGQEALFHLEQWDGRRYPGGMESAWTGWKARAALAPAAVVTDADIETAAQLIYTQWDAVAGYVPWVKGGNSTHQGCARKLARDLFVRLNRRAIPAGLLESLCAPQADRERLKISRLAAAIELRALLGKEGE